jgi:hypothetical protein
MSAEQKFPDIPYRPVNEELYTTFSSDPEQVLLAEFTESHGEGVASGAAEIAIKRMNFACRFLDSDSPKP